MDTQPFEPGSALQNLKHNDMALVQLKLIIDQSKGKWSGNISEIDYIFLKVATEYADDEIRANRLLESQLKNIDIPEEEGLKRRWLKNVICGIVNEPETLEEVRNVSIAEAKHALLTIIIDRLLLLVPGLAGSALRIIERAVVFLLKQAFKAVDRGTINWCEI